MGTSLSSRSAMPSALSTSSSSKIKQCHAFSTLDIVFIEIGTWRTGIKSHPRCNGPSGVAQANEILDAVVQLAKAASAVTTAVLMFLPAVMPAAAKASADALAGGAPHIPSASLLGLPPYRPYMISFHL
eukprot:CAMPEP_0197468088 /NCGR_PEP_ID=MMETSP1175-20131217/65906_1 /TAXON_ID=1003142 /ORGANISM="Triceratium dubium, Strain CCMP147" /LENGTH=128 /DNA_ID=CAMNT_0043004183 /DNA_START=517 /DNA_END=904 /DNA_ORIENTATION=+